MSYPGIVMLFIQYEGLSLVYQEHQL